MRYLQRVCKQGEGGVAFGLSDPGPEGPKEGDTAVEKQSIESPAPSRTTWENLEAHLRLRAQGWLQDLFVA